MKSTSIFDVDSKKGAAAGSQGRFSGWIASRIAYIRDSGWYSFEGRSSRQEYWLPILFGHMLPMIICLPLSIPGALLAIMGAEMGSAGLEYVGVGLLAVVLAGATGLTLWAISAAIVKRLHDLNLSGWVALIYLPLGPFYPFLLILQGCIKGTNGPNRYGDDPVGDMSAVLTSLNRCDGCGTTFPNFNYLTKVEERGFLCAKCRATVG
jgi:uncharacterized membrane protein YhaH (DUF805 family)